MGLCGGLGTPAHTPTPKAARCSRAAPHPLVTPPPPPRRVPGQAAGCTPVSGTRKAGTGNVREQRPCLRLVPAVRASPVPERCPGGGQSGGEPPGAPFLALPSLLHRLSCPRLAGDTSTALTWGPKGLCQGVSGAHSPAHPHAGPWPGQAAAGHACCSAVRSGPLEGVRRQRQPVLLSAFSVGTAPPAPHRGPQLSALSTLAGAPRARGRHAAPAATNPALALQLPA